MNEPLQFEKVSIEDAKKALDHDAPASAQKTAADDQDWRWARKYTRPQPLLDTTKTWLARLPDAVRPTELPSAYPRIANRLCELWADHDACERYFGELLRDHRLAGSKQIRRQGFPGNVAQEIVSLQKHYFDPGEGAALWQDRIYRR